MDWEKAHAIRLQKYEQQIAAIFNDAAKEAAAIGAIFNASDLFSQAFQFSDYPITKDRIDKLMNKVYTGIHGTVVNGVTAEWKQSNYKNDELAQRILGITPDDMKTGKFKNYFNNHDSALQAFIARKESGLKLSDRVWKYTNNFKSEIEMGLDIGIRSGTPASQMARDLKQYLQEPDKLFRRVRDQHGTLQLSKAAKNYHPGQGVYRSSYKNAARLTRTETNMAYRAADHTRHQDFDFIVGIEVRLTNNPGHITDICDDLKGRYPKTFKFIGWHPHCMCHTVTILKTQAELDADTQKILDGKPTDGTSQNAVEKIPDNFKDWALANEKRIQSANTMPYFIRDNFQGTDVKKWFVETAKAPTAAAAPSLSITKPIAAPAQTDEQLLIKQLQGFKNPLTTPEQMLKDPEVLKAIDAIGGKEERQRMIDNYMARSANYQPNTYYRVEGGTGAGYGGAGNGLYLGRDKKALQAFYDIESEGLPVSTYKGEAKWLDLMDPRKEKAWNEYLAKKGIDPTNSNMIGELVQKLGYDGIKYFDAQATGEELVLFNTKVLTKVEAKARAAAIPEGAYQAQATDALVAKMQKKYSWRNLDKATAIQEIEAANLERIRAAVSLKRAAELGIDDNNVLQLVKVVKMDTALQGAMKFRIDALEAKIESINNPIAKVRAVPKPKATSINQVNVTDDILAKFRAGKESWMNEEYAKNMIIEANKHRETANQLLQELKSKGIDTSGFKNSIVVANNPMTRTEELQHLITKMKIELQRPGKSEIFEFNTEVQNRIKSNFPGVEFRFDKAVTPYFYKTKVGQFNIEDLINDVGTLIAEEGIQMENCMIDERFGDFNILIRGSTKNGDFFKLERRFTTRNVADKQVRTVMHEYLIIPDDLQGNGLSKNIFKSLYKQYQAGDVQRIEVHANLDIGGYTWARYGFKANPRSLPMLRNYIDEIQKAATKGVRRVNTKTGKYYRDMTSAEIREFDNTFREAINSGKPFDMNEFSSRKWVQETGILTGSDWSGFIDLMDDGQRKIFEKYLSR